MIFLTIFALLAGCGTSGLLTDPARQHTDLTTGQVGQTTSNNPGKTLTRTNEKFHADGTLAERSTLTETGASQFFSMPDFAGENWTMYAGIGMVVAGGAMLFFPLTSPFAITVAGGGVVLIALGSWLKTPAAPWVVGLLLIGGLAYVAYRNRKALIGVVKGVESADKTAQAAVKSSIYKTTTEGDDKIIKSVK